MSKLTDSLRYETDKFLMHMSKKDYKKIDPEQILHEIQFQMDRGNILADILKQQDPAELEVSFLDHPIDPLNRQIAIHIKRYIDEINKCAVSGSANRRIRLTKKNRHWIVIQNVLHITNALLVELNKNSNDYFYSEQISVFEVRLSTIAILDFLDSINVLFNTYEYLIGAILTMTTTRGPVHIPEYRLIYIDAHLTDVLIDSSNLLNKAGIALLLHKIKEIRKEGDPLIVFDGKSNNYGFTSADTITGLFRHKSSNFVKGLALFRNIGTYFDVHKHDRFLKLQATKDWLDARVLLLKYELTNMAENSEEHIKISSSVEFYEKDITRIDKKLDIYLNRK